MTNKTQSAIIFVAGLLTGGAAGAAISYFLTRDYYIDHFTDAMDKYAESCNERIEDIVSYYERGGEYYEEDETVEDPRDEICEELEGVKKYHRYSAALSDSSTAQEIFAKKVEDTEVTEGEKALVRDKSLTDVDGIVEIDEDEFLNCPEDYYQEYLRYDFNEDILYWGYGSDNEIEAEEHFGKGREELIGKLWRWAPDYVKDPDEMEGSAYVKNDNLMTYFEIVVHYDPNADVKEVSEE